MALPVDHIVRDELVGARVDHSSIVARLWQYVGLYLVLSDLTRLDTEDELITEVLDLEVFPELRDQILGADVDLCVNYICSQLKWLVLLLDFDMLLVDME